MYRAFNLKIKKEQFDESYNELLAIGSHNDIQWDKEVEPMLNALTDDGIINGTQLSNNWFDTICSDIFISYSHNDEELAMVLSGWLKDTFGLDVFLDKYVWGSADRLLKTIDDVYCKNNNGSYNYNKRNFSTSHVHAMLCTAIMRVMDQSEAVFFLNTEQSVSATKQTARKKMEFTQSPWIYTEITLASLLRSVDWASYRKKSFLEHAQESTREQRALKIQYNIPTEQLAPIDANSLNDWFDAYSKRKKMDVYGGLLADNFDHPLNYLYDVVFGIEP